MNRLSLRSDGVVTGVQSNHQHAPSVESRETDASIDSTSRFRFPSECFCMDWQALLAKGPVKGLVETAHLASLTPIATI